MNWNLLQTERLVLRNYEPADWEQVHVYASNPEFSKYEVWGPNSIDDTKIFIDKMIKQTTQTPRSEFDFAVCLKNSGLLIGGCGIRRASESSHFAKLGWAITPEHQNKGYATEAARALIRFGFEELGLALICATCDARNIASYSVMEKLKMKRVGLLKNERMQKGSLRDTLRYELVQSSSSKIAVNTSSVALRSLK